jgi:hypothetical protein
MKQLREIKLSELYELRKVYEHGRNCASLGVVIPHKFLVGTKIEKGDVKLYLEQNKIWIQKLENNGELISE